MIRPSQQLKTLKAKHVELKARIQLLEASEKSRKRKRETITDLDTYIEHLQKRQYQRLEMQHRVLSFETHDTIFPVAFTQGSIYVFKNKN